MSLSEDTEFHVSSRRWIPCLWRRETVESRTPERIAATDRSNLKRLRMLLEHETREAVPPELSTLEALAVETLRCVKPIPPSRTVVLCSDGVEWTEATGTPAPASGDTGRVQLFLNPDLPYEVEFFAEVRSVVGAGDRSRVLVHLLGCSPQVLELYQQLVFIYHRTERRAASIAEGTP